MKDENKTVNVNFRLSPKHKKWLELIVDDYNTTASAYFYYHIFEDIKNLIITNASNEAKISAAKEFGLSDNITSAIHTPDDIEGLLGSDKNRERFLYLWLMGIIKSVDRQIKEYEISMEDGELENLLSDVFGEKIKIIIHKIKENKEGGENANE